MLNSQLNLLYSRQEIEKTIKLVSNTIQNKISTTNEPVVFIGVLNGAFMFFSDLMKNVNNPCEIDFIKASSYKGMRQGEVVITKDIDINIKDKTVFLVDDIIDSGNTYGFLKSHLEIKSPTKIIPVSLFKRGITKVDELIYGFEVNDEFLIGYGFDDENGKSRNLPYILGQNWNVD